MAGEPRLWPFYTDRAIARVAERVRDGDLAAMERDADVERCEEQIAQTLLARDHVLLCATGTAALASTFFALGLSPGAEVLVPTHTFRATVTPLLAQGLRPVLCDADAATGNIDLDDAERKITARTEALVVTHVWGRPVPLDRLRSLARAHGLAVVEDCSHAHGVRWRGQPVGSVGDIAVFSLGGIKMVSGGLGGVLITGDRSCYERALLFGQPKYRGLLDSQDPTVRALLQTGLGHNLRASPVSACLVQDHLDRLPETVAVKNANLDLLAETIARRLPRLTPVPVPAGRTAGTLYKFHCRWSEVDGTRADDVLAALRAKGMRVRRPMVALHETALFRDPGLLAALQPSAPLLDPVDPQGFPGCDSLLAGLVEWDTRDLYESGTDAVARYDAMLSDVADRLPVGQGTGC